MVGPPSEELNCDVCNDELDRETFLQISARQQKSGGATRLLISPHDAATLSPRPADRAARFHFPGSHGRARHSVRAGELRTMGRRARSDAPYQPRPARGDNARCFISAFCFHLSRFHLNT
jgi:hypothetical protein